MSSLEGLSPAVEAAESTLDASMRLPRDGDGPVFRERWHGRAFALGVVTLERRGLTWSDFQPHLAHAISQRPATDDASADDVYYLAFLDAVEAIAAP